MGSEVIQTEPSWEQILTQGLTQPLQLLHALDLKPQDLQWPIDIHSPFKTKVPQPFVARMQSGNPRDPLLLQVLATQAESRPAVGYSTEPLNESDKLEVPGLISKYAHRVLLTLTGACPINCRYCFRRAFPYTDIVPRQRDWQRTYDYIAADKTIEEVIYSGGDPLILKDSKLAEHITYLASIDHVETLRIHTRTIIALPQRVTNGLEAALALWPRRLVVVQHSNHPAEIDDGVTLALGRLAKMGCTLLNQSVLLAGVNDDATVLAALSKQLLAARTLPYYLHALDKVAGSAHFEVSDERALLIMSELLTMLPGYLVPRFVREVPGAASKTPL